MPAGDNPGPTSLPGPVDGVIGAQVAPATIVGGPPYVVLHLRTEDNERASFALPADFADGVADQLRIAAKTARRGPP
jgi:hypothetical protein